jgi:cellular nucleic acid-binding protein
MDQSLRQRGWSIYSSDDHDSSGAQQQRPRADTCDTEPSMSEAEKVHLLNSAFEGSDGADDGDVVVAMPLPLTLNAGVDAMNRLMSDSIDEGEEEEEDCLLVFGGENEGGGGSDSDVRGSDAPPQNEPGGPPNKRHKTGEGNAVATVYGNGRNDGSEDDVSSSEDDCDAGDKLKKQTRPHVQLTQKQQDQLDHAKNKLSKWAARLFDPNRPRGLVEPPKVIPLNDEFLTAFGKREREHDEIAGRGIDIDKTSLDIIDISDNDENEESAMKATSKEDKKLKYSEMSNCKVKITNLSYKTTSAAIARNFESIGPVVDVNLILDDNGQSSGRAYVVFEDHETALSCVEKMNEKSLEGRSIRISLASASYRKSLDPSKKQDSRYWERDISTKCNSCGEVGHIARNCPNEQLIKCGLCATVGHDMWSCPDKSVCFNCGLPGHVVRDCNQRRGLPQRCVCTICFRSGHHRFQCRERPWHVPTEDAVCMQCGQMGHFMCSEMRWFFGLKGVTCFKCGMKDHRGVDCRRPDVDVCQKNFEIAQREIDMADTNSL